MNGKAGFILALVVAVGLPASSQLLSDEFNYPIGDLLTDHGWTQSHADNVELKVTGGSLSYAGFSSPGTGNSVSITQTFSTESVKRSFPAQASGVVYVSFLVRIESAISTDFTGSGILVQAGGIGMTSDPDGVRLMANEDSGKIAFRLTKTGSFLAPTGPDYDFNTTHLIVLKYEFVGGTSTDDLISLFVNPVMSGVEPAPTVTTGSGSADALELAEVGINGWDFDPPGAEVSRFIVDALRVETSWPTGPLDEVFLDDFESAGVTNWSSSVP